MAVADGKKAIPESKEETRVRSMGFLGTPGGGVSGVVDVKDGKIVRIRPLHYDWQYKWEDMNPWKVERNGKKFVAGTVYDPAEKEVIKGGQDHSDRSRQ